MKDHVNTNLNILICDLMFSLKIMSYLLGSIQKAEFKMANDTKFSKYEWFQKIIFLVQNATKNLVFHFHFLDHFYCTKRNEKSGFFSIKFFKRNSNFGHLQFDFAVPNKCHDFYRLSQKYFIFPYDIPRLADSVFLFVINIWKWKCVVLHVYNESDENYNGISAKHTFSPL